MQLLPLDEGLLQLPTVTLVFEADIPGSFFRGIFKLVRINIVMKMAPSRMVW
jgi:hypothetical protein